MHIDAVREGDGYHRQARYRFGAQGSKSGRAVDGILDLLGYQLFDLLRSEARGLRLNVDLRRYEFREDIQRGTQRLPAAENQRQYRKRGNRAEVTHAQRDQCPHHC